MPKIIRESYTEEIVSHELAYDYNDEPGSGFSFPCDEDGNVNEDDLQPAARINLAQCREGIINGRFSVTCKGVRTDRSTYRHPRVIECPRCRSEVVLEHHFTNSCDQCYTDFDGNGHVLAPREQWGEETGETPADILSIPPADRWR